MILKLVDDYKNKIEIDTDNLKEYFFVWPDLYCKNRYPYFLLVTNDGKEYKISYAYQFGIIKDALIQSKVPGNLS